MVDPSEPPMLIPPKEPGGARAVLGHPELIPLMTQAVLVDPELRGTSAVLAGTITLGSPEKVCPPLSAESQGTDSVAHQTVVAYGPSRRGGSQSPPTGSSARSAIIANELELESRISTLRRNVKGATAATPRGRPGAGRTGPQRRPAD